MFSILKDDTLHVNLRKGFFEEKKRDVWVGSEQTFHIRNIPKISFVCQIFHNIFSNVLSLLK